MSDGAYFAVAPCFLCRQTFTFNPLIVPSVTDQDGARRPMCRSCAEWANALRERRGIEGRWHVCDEAYAPVEGLP